MNCKDFAGAMHEIVTRRAAPRTRQLEALEHASHCLWCAVRLDEETRLTEDLQGFAKVVHARQAPPRVEEALLRAFREKASRVAAARGKPVGVGLWRRLGWSVALAGAVAGALIAVWWGPRLLRHSNALTPQIAQSRPLKPSAPLQAKAEQPVTAGQTEARVNKVALNTLRRQVATDFIPLGTCDDPGCMDEAVLVRLALPSETLLMLGLPVDNDFASGALMADVVLGPDGVPYAIRFVN
jgi:hypothetical protein